MHVLLLNLPWSENGRLGVRAGSRWPFTSPPEEDGRIHYIPFPFFLAYATSLLKKEDKQARLIDSIAEGTNEDELIKQIKIFNPELLVIETSTPSFRNDLRVISNICLNNPEASIALCGPHASVFPAEILKEQKLIKYVLIGEYEYTLLELVNSLENKLNLDSVPGLAYHNGSAVKINSPRRTINDLDILPWPDREDVPIYAFNDAFAGLPVPNVQMLASRGCPFQCTYCLWPQTVYREHRYRPRAPEKVADEMEYLVGHFNFKAVYFDDDTFNIDKEHVLDICDQITKRKIKIPWAIMARADLMDAETLERMSLAGLYAVKYGIESAGREVLENCKKDMDLEKVKDVILLTKKMGIKVHLAFCIGLAGETRESIRETLRFIEDTKPDSLQFSIAVPFPGTEYFDYLKSKGWLISEDWSDYDGNYKCVLKTKELEAKELERISIALNNNRYLQ